MAGQWPRVLWDMSSNASFELCLDGPYLTASGLKNVKIKQNISPILIIFEKLVCDTLPISLATCVLNMKGWLRSNTLVMKY